MTAVVGILRQLPHGVFRPPKWLCSFSGWKGLARKMEITIDQRVDVAYIRGASDRYDRNVGERRPAQSVMKVIKDAASNHLQRAKPAGCEHILEHALKKAFVAFNYACQNATPEIMSFMERIAWGEIPARRLDHYSRS